MEPPDGATPAPGPAWALHSIDTRFPPLSPTLSEDAMKTIRALLTAALVVLAAAACSGDVTGPTASDCPTMGAGNPRCE